MNTLRIVATPIGNLEDITLRALRVLNESDYILCEDTRTSSKLLNNYKIKTTTISFHQHSKDAKFAKVFELLKNNNNIALITDAGTPGISDPGSKLVEVIREKQKEGELKDVIIESVPGVSALTAAISIAGTGFDHFLFLGFLPHKKGRQAKLKEIASSNYSIVLYESKHRILKLLSELKEIEKNHKLQFDISIARELTKMHENFYSGGIEELISKLEENNTNIKGEFVVLLKKDKKKNAK
jgi:16S rRNA (cytidine1402-2'-O)-methyltransferase